MATRAAPVQLLIALAEIFHSRGLLSHGVQCAPAVEPLVSFGGLPLFMHLDSTILPFADNNTSLHVPVLNVLPPPVFAQCVCAILIEEFCVIGQD